LQEKKVEAQSDAHQMLVPEGHLLEQEDQVEHDHEPDVL
jgi:hypothetical protein